jgi:hypothetical protein
MIPLLTPQQAVTAETAQWKELIRQAAADLRVAIPGIIQSFDPVRQLAVVQVALRENVRTVVNTTTGQSSYKDVAIQPLKDVLVVIPRGGGYSFTLPLRAGDECLLVFGDMARDLWWVRGGVQNQFEKRRHDISDAFCIPGPWSNPRALANWSTTSAQLRSDDGTVVIDVAETGVTVTAPKVETVTPAATIGASGGTAQPLVNQAWLTWYETNIQPFLVSKGYSGPAQPSASVTTVLEAE